MMVKTLDKLSEKIKTQSQKLEALKKKQSALEKKIKSQKLAQERKREQHKKFLIGTVVLSEMCRDMQFKCEIMRLLECSLSNEEDRELLGLSQANVEEGKQWHFKKTLLIDFKAL